MGITITTLYITGFQEISVEEFGEELGKKLKTIIDECLKPEKSRPEMHLVLSILKGKVTAHKNKVELYCVGTGTGTTGTKARWNLTEHPPATIFMQPHLSYFTIKHCFTEHFLEATISLL